MNPTLVTALADLKQAGLTFADCVKAFGVPRAIDPYAAAAHAIYHRDGAIEIDETTVRSGSSGAGDYVLAWVWVDAADAIVPAADLQDETGPRDADA